jgi:hypothetical protein
MESEVTHILLLLVKYRRMGYGVWGKQFVIVCLELCMPLVYVSVFLNACVLLLQLVQVSQLA